LHLKSTLRLLKSHNTRFATVSRKITTKTLPNILLSVRGMLVESLKSFSIATIFDIWSINSKTI
jgi:hypothetical protein